MNYIEKYLTISKQMLDEVFLSQESNLIDTAKRLADVIGQNGIIYIFGCGHSHIFAEDVFYRAGGLAPIRPIFIEPLMLHEGAARSSILEKKNNFINEYLTSYHITDKDALIVISSSGINPVPIDVALWGHKHKALTIAITSFIYAEKLTSRHISGKFLRDVTDIAIDNKVPLGDAVITIDECGIPFAPISSMIGIFLMQSLCAQIIAFLAKKSNVLPIFLSGNIPGSDDHNKKILTEYKDKVPELMLNL